MDIADDSMWLTASHDLADEWIEDDTMGSLYLEAARNRPRQGASITGDVGSAEASSPVPRPRGSDRRGPNC